MLLYLHPTLKLQAGQVRQVRQAHPKSDEKRIIQYRVVAALGLMCIVAYHAVYLDQLD
jgi:hypothetical protein